MKESKLERQIRRDMAAGHFKGRKVLKKEDAELRAAAANTLRKLERIQKFRGIRKDLALSQSGMAAALQVSKRTVESWEARHREIPEPMMLLAELLRDVPAVRKRLLAA